MPWEELFSAVEPHYQGQARLHAGWAGADATGVLRTAVEWFVGRRRRGRHRRHSSGYGFVRFMSFRVEQALAASILSTYQKAVILRCKDPACSGASRRSYRVMVMVMVTYYSAKTWCWRRLLRGSQKLRPFL